MENKVLEVSEYKLYRKIDWLKKLFDLDTREVNVSLETVEGGYHLCIKEGDSAFFTSKGEAEEILKALAPWTMKLRIYISEEGVVVVERKKPTPAKDWRVVPNKIGISWADDPVDNEIHLGQPWRWDDSWSPIEDPIITKDYMEDLKSLLW